MPGVYQQIYLTSTSWLRSQTLSIYTRTKFKERRTGKKNGVVDEKPHKDPLPHHPAEGLRVEEGGERKQDK